MIEDELAVRTRNLDFKLREVQAVLQHPFIDAPVYVKRDGTSENKGGVKVPIEMKTKNCLSELTLSFLNKSANQLAVGALELEVDYGYLIIVSRVQCFPKEFTIVKLKGLTKFTKSYRHVKSRRIDSAIFPTTKRTKHRNGDGMKEELCITESE